MSFLEFVCTKLMGKPAYGSMWKCPFHDDHSPSFSVRPPKAGHRIRFKCWGCGAWGDEHDLLRLFYPREDYGQRLNRIAELRREYEAAGGESDSTSPGAGSDRFAVVKAWLEIDRTLSEWESSDAHALQTVKMVLSLCNRSGVGIEDVVRYWEATRLLEAVVASYDAAWDRSIEKGVSAQMPSSNGKAKQNGRA